MKTIDITRFIKLINDIQKDKDREFCFILGAGSSASAGIPTAFNLAKEWYDELEEQLGKTDFEIWKKELSDDEAKALKNEDFGFLYSKIYSKRFEYDKQTGYNQLINAMKGKQPSFGHIIMAWVLQYTRHNTIVTTNFDGLLETAIYKYSTSHPMVCGHESMTQYAKPSKEIPLIVKVHRDLFTDPMSKEDEIDKLKTSWKPVLDKIIGQRTPIVIGYGGNDGSLMTYLENMTKPDNIFWCLYKDEEPNDRIKTLIENQKGVFIKTNGFDEVMKALMVPFPEIQGQEKKYKEETNKNLKGLNTWLESDKSNVKSAYEYYEIIEEEKDIELKGKLFEDAIRLYENVAWLNGNYALYLNEIKGDYTQAEIYYKKALELDPKDSNYNGNYALFLTNVKKEQILAEIYFKKAIEFEPNDNYFYGSYASFLKLIKKDYQEAEIYFRKALGTNSNKAINNSNYAVYLLEIKKDYLQAEIYYKKVFELDSKDANNNANYAQLLLQQKRIDEATSLIENAFENTDEENLLLELWFYRYAHNPAFLEQAEKEIEKLLTKGAKSEGWNFDENIKVAIEEGHPNPERLKELAKMISSPLVV